MRVLVSGDQRFTDFNLLRKKLDVLTLPLATVEVVTSNNVYRVYVGHKTYLVGADALAVEWACKRKYTYMVSHEKKLEGRHKEMVSLSKVAVIFWDGKDEETAALVALCKRSKLKLRVINY